MYKMKVNMTNKLELSEMLGLSQMTLWNMIRVGKVPGPDRKIGKREVYSDEQVGRVLTAIRRQGMTSLLSVGDFDTAVVRLHEAVQQYAVGLGEYDVILTADVVFK